MLVSVVLPYHNRADSLTDSAMSVLRQTHHDVELILVDDCSTDGADGVARSLKDARIRHLRTESRLGPSGARNLGIDAASGRYLAFQDSDDVWEDDKLEVQLRLLTDVPAANVAAVGCGSTLFDEPRRIVSGPPRSYVADDVLRGCVRGSGTPMLLLDLQRADASVRFDPTFPAFEERDYLFRSVGAARVLVSPHSLVWVRRGRTDHVTTPDHAIAGYERLLAKYSTELAEMTQARDWYRYKAMREALQIGRVDVARRHYRSIRADQGVRLRLEYLLGRAARRRGLAVASRLHLQPDWSGRCR